MLLNRAIARIDPNVYQGYKARLKRALPLSPEAIARLSDYASTLHQRHLESFVFIHITKCGGTSIERALGIPLLNHDTALERRAKLGERRWSERYKFTVVRNPYERMASLYVYWFAGRHPGPAELQAGFAPWIRKIAASVEAGTARPLEGAQWAWLSDAQGEFLLDDIYCLEDLDARLPELEEKLGFRVPLGHTNVGKRRGYDDLLDDETRRIIRRAYAVDFEKLGYAA